LFCFSCFRLHSAKGNDTLTETLKAVAFTRPSFAEAHPQGRRLVAVMDRTALARIIEAHVRIMAALLDG